MLNNFDIEIKDQTDLHIDKFVDIILVSVCEEISSFKDLVYSSKHHIEDHISFVKPGMHSLFYDKHYNPQRSKNIKPKRSDLYC